MSLERRLSELEARASGQQWETPLEVLVLLKAVVRHRAHIAGEEPPAYTQAETEEMHRDDLETVAGGGVVGQLRSGAGWSSPDALDRLDEWEESARRRLERIENGEPLEVVYDEHDEEELDGE